MSGGFAQAESRVSVKPLRFASAATCMVLGLALVVGAMADGTVMTALQLKGQIAASAQEFGRIALEVSGTLVLGAGLFFVGAWLLPGARET